MSIEDEQIPEPRVERGRRRWPSIIWLVPILAVLGAAWLLMENISGRGPLITIAFETATGLKAGESVVKYRDVEVGRVEQIRFSPDLETVLADVRMVKTVEAFLDESAQFWVVSPQVSAQGITGLETVITGTYIEGSWDTEPGPLKTFFEASAEPPSTPAGAPGVRIVLRAVETGSLDVGSPILFKGFDVGQVESKKLAEDGKSVEFSAFVRAPNDRYVTEAARFWNTSGIDLELGTEGARLKVASLSSLLRGGASFEVLNNVDAAPVEDGHVFELFGSESEASENVVIGDPGDLVELQINFEGSVRGLKPGASVEYRGIRIGNVRSVNAAVDPDDGRFRTQTRIGLSPTLMGLDQTDRDGLLKFLDTAIERGLRAKLAMGNLLTGSLYVNLEDDPAAPLAEFDPESETPELPAVASDLEELTGSVEGILKRVDALPIEALLANATSVLENLNRITASDATQAIPETTLNAIKAAETLLSRPELGQATIDAQALIAALRGVAEDPAFKAAPGNLNDALGSLSAITGELEKQKTAADLAATIAALRSIAERPEWATLPERASKALEAAETLVSRPELGRTAKEAEALVTALRELAEDPALKSAPTKIDAVLSGVASITAELQKQETAANLGATVAALRAFVETPEFGRIPGQAETALAALAALLAEPGLQQMPDQINKTLADLRKALDLPGLDKVPADLRATLASVRTRLDDPALGTALAELPPLIKDARGAVNEFSASSDAALKSLSRILDDPGTKAAPEEVTATLRAARALLEDEGLKNAAGEAASTLAALRVILEDPKTKAAPQELTATLASARKLLGSLEEQRAAQNLASALAAAEKLLSDPALTRASNELANTLTAIRAVLDTDGARELPPALVDALRSATVLIDDFQRQNVSGSAAGAFDGVNAASRAIEKSVAGLPALITRLRSVSKRADGLLESISVGSELNYEAVTAIREIRDAARAVIDLSDLIQRRPNAIILGK